MYKLFNFKNVKYKVYYKEFEEMQYCITKITTTDDMEIPITEFPGRTITSWERKINKEYMPSWENDSTKFDGLENQDVLKNEEEDLIIERLVVEEDL